MVLAPISAYFLSKNYVYESKILYLKLIKLYIKLNSSLLDVFDIKKEDSYIYAALTAVVVVHIILAAFIYAAWKDANTAAITKKKE